LFDLDLVFLDDDEVEFARAAVSARVGLVLDARLRRAAVFVVEEAVAVAVGPRAAVPLRVDRPLIDAALGGAFVVDVGEAVAVGVGAAAGLDRAGSDGASVDGVEDAVFVVVGLGTAVVVVVTCVEVDLSKLDLCSSSSSP
jgi:hypothetical protein